MILYPLRCGQAESCLKHRRFLEASCCNLISSLSVHVTNDDRRMRFNNDVGTDEDAVHLAVCLHPVGVWLIRFRHH